MDMMKLKSDEDRALKAKMTTEEIIQHKTIHHMFLYGHNKSVVPDEVELIPVTDDEVLFKTYGDYDWKKEFFKHNGNDHAHTTYSINAIGEMIKRRRTGDIILCFWGAGNRQTADMFANECIVVEPGIGYPAESCFAPFRVFESYAVMHYHYGLEAVIHPSWYHAVIPNYFNPDDFDFVTEKKNYFLYLGRITASKGLEIVMYLAKKIGFRLLIAGQGSLEKDLGLKTVPCNIEYVGYADIEKRKKLMAHAKGLFLATYYVEPFGGVTMEAMMSGTPVITTDWGVFAETVIHGVTGYRCRTLDQFEWAVRNIDKIDPSACREWALKNYSIEKVRGMYEEYFDMLLKVKFAKGFYHENVDRTELNWLYREYPIQATNASVPKSITYKSKPKIALFTEAKWAFGRISQAIQKYSTYDIDILDWESNGGFDNNYFDTYDLIYTTCWDVARTFEKRHPVLADRLIFSGHGVVDFMKMDIDKTEHEDDNKKLTPQEVDDFKLQPELVEWLRNRKLPFSVVSHQLYDLLTSEPYNLNCVCLTQCGADLEVFQPIVKDANADPDAKLKVIFTLILTDKYPQGYDVKRKTLIKTIKDVIDRENLPIEIIVPTEIISSQDMPAFYQQGDVYLCTSHTEGNPLGVFESGACGLTTITTPVGETPYVIKDSVNGFLIENNIDTIVPNVIEKLKLLAEDRDLLKIMQKNMQRTIEHHWSWKNKVKQWDEYFAKCLSILEE
jgi:glycosyltransferase involved in cell wall biosynthesis